MLTRRDILIRALMAGAGCALARTAGLSATASQPSTKITFDVPAGSCDCHVHVFGDPRRYPFFAGRTYTPDAAPVEELRALLAALHIDRVVVVQPSVYGTDNTCTLDAIRVLGTRARGVAVIDAHTSEAALDRMAQIGIRGIRLNLSQLGINEPAAALREFRAVAQRAAPRGWHVQFNTSLTIIDAITPQLLESRVPVVFDHFGGARGVGGPDQPGFAALVRLVKAGTAYVKISGAADQVSTMPPDYSDALPLAQALVAANPQRILWGSAWPHPGSTPGGKPTDLSLNKPIDDGRVLNLLPVWVPDPMTRRAILVDNPARLYGY